MIWNKKSSFIVGTSAIAVLAFGASAFKRNNPIHRNMTASIGTAISSSSTNLSKKEESAAKFWNRSAKSYHKQPIQDEETYRKKLEITREYMSPYSRVLEFGCGTGETAVLHAPYVSSVHAIDLSSKMIEIAEERKKEANVDNVQFECTGIDSLNVPNGNYDMVMGLSILHLLPNKDDVVKKIHDKLKAGGYFVSSTTCMGDSSKAISWLISPISSLGLLPEINIFTKAELRSSIEEAGFKIEREFQPPGNDKSVFLVARKL